jgi:cytochrome bd ubiquinol oxidase subunit II
VLPPVLTIAEAARGRATLVATLVVLIAGALVLVPALIYLYVLFQRAVPESPAPPLPASGNARETPRGGSMMGR